MIPLVPTPYWWSTSATAESLAPSTTAAEIDYASYPNSIKVGILYLVSCILYLVSHYLTSTYTHISSIQTPTNDTAYHIRQGKLPSSIEMTYSANPLHEYDLPSVRTLMRK